MTAMLSLAVACGHARQMRSVELFVVRIEVKSDDIYLADTKTGPWTTLATPNARVTVLDSSAAQLQASSQSAVPTDNRARYRVTIDPTRSLLSGRAALTPAAVRSELARIAAVSRPPAPDVRVEYIVQSTREKLPER